MTEAQSTVGGLVKNGADVEMDQFQINEWTKDLSLSLNSSSSNESDKEFEKKYNLLAMNKRESKERWNILVNQ